ncbi:hypothetical protein GOODEAATRI_013593 [Goodea atripinnis]|uniref:Uncharacterized protein n=1 Tax=Goodea atripinnis TaxID=208336 RepID=A0ABV0PDW3_9TELE
MASYCQSDTWTLSSILTSDNLFSHKPSANYIYVCPLVNDFCLVEDHIFGFWTEALGSFCVCDASGKTSHRLESTERIFCLSNASLPLSTRLGCSPGLPAFFLL